MVSKNGNNRKLDPGILTKYLPVKGRGRTITVHGLAIGLYTILAGAVIFPVLMDMNGLMAGQGDAWQVLYMLWYSKQAVLGGDPNLTLTYTNYLYYPYGTTMILYAFSLFGQLLSIPLQMLWGLVAAYNILWLLSFILAGYGAFLLVKYLTGNEFAGLVGGLAFAFSPYHFEQAQMHLGAMTIEWIPFCALFLMRMFREGGLKNAFLAGIFFIMVALSDFQYMVYMGLFAGLLLLYELYAAVIKKPAAVPGGAAASRLEGLKNIAARYAVFAGTAFAGIIPISYQMIQITLSGNNFLKPEMIESVQLSGDLAGFFVPSALHPLFGSWLLQNVYSRFTGNITEYITYIGFTVLALSAYAVICRFREKEIRFWTASAIFFIIMVLGPALHVMGVVPIGLNHYLGLQVQGYDDFIPLPYLALYQVFPVLQDSRDVSRADVMVSLAFAVLAGYGLALFLARVGGERRRLAALCLVCGLIVFEFAAVMPISRVEAPPVYEQIGLDTAHYALLDIPIATDYDTGERIEFYETVHGKPIVGGRLPRTDPNASGFEENTPFINKLVYMGVLKYEPSHDIFNQDAESIGNYLLNYYGIGYVILHKENLSGWALNDDEVILDNALNTMPTYEDGHVVAYKVPDARPVLFMVPRSGWYDPQSDGLNVSRYMENTSVIDVIAPENGTYDLNISINSFYQPRTLDLLVNGQSVYRQPIPLTGTEVSVPVTLTAGGNQVTLNSIQEPAEGAFYFKFQEQIGFAVSNVSVVRHVAS